MDRLLLVKAHAHLTITGLITFVLITLVTKCPKNVQMDNAFGMHIYMEMQQIVVQFARHLVIFLALYKLVVQMHQIYFVSLLVQIMNISQ